MIVGSAGLPTAGTIAVCGNDRSNRATNLAERRRRGQEAQIVFQDPTAASTPASPAPLPSTRWCCSTTAAANRSARPGSIELGRSGRPRRPTATCASPGALGRTTATGRDRPALAAEPRLLILDESVAALDVSIQAQVLNLLADIRAQTGVSYLLISHDLAVVRQITEHTIVMHRGSVVERGPTARVLDHRSDPYTRRLRDSVPRAGWKPTATRSPNTGARRLDRLL